MPNDKKMAGGSWRSSQWYSDKRLDGVPRYWEPGGKNTGTHLAYITDEEIDVLKRQAKRNNIDLIEHKGPMGVPFFASSLVSVSPNNTSEEVAKSVPVRWKSSPDHPVANLVYVTGAQAKLLKRLDIHGSGVDKHDHYGPDNVPSYQGDGGGGGGDGGGGDSGGDSGGTGAGTGDTSGTESGVSTDTSGATSSEGVASSGAETGVSTDTTGALAGLSSAEVGQGEQDAIDATNAMDALGQLSSAAVGQAELDAIAQSAQDMGLSFSLSSLTAKDVLGALAMAKTGPLGVAMAALSLAGKATGNPGLSQAAQGIGVLGNFASGNIMGAASGALGLTGLGNIGLGQLGSSIGTGGVGGTGVAGGGGDAGGIGVDSGTSTAGGTTAGGTTAGGTTSSSTTPSGVDLGLLLALLASSGAPSASSSGETTEDSTVSTDPLVPFDWAKPLQTTPFATPRAATKNSLDELLGILQYRG